MALGYSLGGPIASYMATLPGPVQLGAVYVDPNPPDASRTFLKKLDPDAFAALASGSGAPADPAMMAMIEHLAQEGPSAGEQSDFAPQGPESPVAKRLMGRPSVPTALIVAIGNPAQAIPTFQSHQLHMLHGAPEGKTFLERVATGHGVASVSEGRAAIVRALRHVLECLP